MIADGLCFQLQSIRFSAHAAHEAFGGTPQSSADLHVVHTIEGRGFLHLGAEVHEARPDVVLVPPAFARCAWEKRSGEAWAMINLHVRVANGAVALHESPLLPLRFPAPDPPELGPKLRDIHRRWAGTSRLGALTAGADAIAILADHLARHGRDTLDAIPDDPVMVIARQALEAQADRPFDLTASARQAGMPSREYARRFRAAWGASPKSFWQAHRLSLAQERLASTREAIGEIAQGLGFADIYYFSRWFKHRAGVTPSAFRRDAKHF